jgi:5'-nucleotidase
VIHMEKPLILVTNDDGYDAPGLQALVSEIKDSYRVVVSAPKENQSGMGRAVRLRRPLAVEEYDIDGVKTYAVASTPATAVILALSSFLERLPDLVVSGINNGENLSPTILRSGTFGAALEGRMYGVSSLAVSIVRPIGFPRDDVDFGCAPQIAARFIEHLLSLDGHHFLNVNIPYGASLDT